MNIDPMRVLKRHGVGMPRDDDVGFNEHRPDEGTETWGCPYERESHRRASMNIDPMRVLKRRQQQYPSPRRAGFNEHRPDEGTETQARRREYPRRPGFNEHRPDEGTET